MADIGVNTVMKFIDRLRDRVKSENITDPELLKEIIVDELFIIYVNDEVLSSKINYRTDGEVSVLLFVGVNGVGKTTTIAKLANKMKDEGHKVLLVGADTFRAGATEQLNEWADRIGVGFCGNIESNDPASVVYDGIQMAKDEGYDYSIENVSKPKLGVKYYVDVKGWAVEKGVKSRSSDVLRFRRVVSESVQSMTLFTICAGVVTAPLLFWNSERNASVTLPFSTINS